MTPPTQTGAKITEIARRIPDVFRRMPIELLRRYAQHGVTGAKDEVRQRRTAGAFEKESKTIKCERGPCGDSETR